MEFLLKSKYGFEQVPLHRPRYCCAALPCVVSNGSDPSPSVPHPLTPTPSPPPPMHTASSPPTATAPRPNRPPPAATHPDDDR